MNSRKLGDIPLDDYLRWTTGRRPWPRPLRVLALLLLCAVCVAAGAYGPWPGHFRDLSLADAERILASSSATPDDQRHAVVAITEKLEETILKLGEAARLTGPAGGDACRSLRHAVVDSLEQIRQLTSEKTHREIQQKSVDLIKKAVIRIEEALGK